jgi:glycosyltransferase involved in cell wall biosynthesis
LGQGLQYEGFLPYGKIQKLLPSFDVGFFSLAGDSYDYAMPRKLFDYMIAGLPILAALPDGEATRFVGQLNIGKVTHYSDVDALADNLYLYAVDKDEIGRIRKNIRSVREQYSLQKQVEALSIRVKEMVS